MRKLYKIKHIFIGHRIYKLTNGFSIRVNITVNEINRI